MTNTYAVRKKWLAAGTLRCGCGGVSVVINGACKRCHEWETRYYKESLKCHGANTRVKQYIEEYKLCV
jgi:hypothetical protein